MTVAQSGRIVMAGGTGFLGEPLVARLRAAGHEVVLLSRRPHPDRAGVRTVVWSPESGEGDCRAVVDGAAAVINLAGASIAGKRWSPEWKAGILNSRIASTRALAGAIVDARNPPPVFVSGSAVGVYGPCGDEPVTELTPPGKDFLAGVCVKWEAEAVRAESDRTRVAIVRTGLPLAGNGGALHEMLPPFRFGVGGPIGSGRQYWPWIHREDWLSLVMFALSYDDLSGPINATAPMPVTNREFAQALGRAMHRPSIVPAPAFALKLLLGEMAEALLLSGQRALPAKATRSGFQFRFNHIAQAFADIFARAVG